ncbi:hypothetical protein [Reyranella sp.]|uniref:hypothetical protein n=1 Tax=Reyranella sp. TaxID=1929291 RepID=UPI003D138DC0
MRQLHHGGDIANQLDLRLGTRGYHDPLDQGADELEGLCLEKGIGKRGLQARDALAIDLSQIGVHADSRDLSIGQQLLQLGLPGFKPVEAGEQARIADPGGDGLDQAVDASIDSL